MLDAATFCRGLVEEGTVYSFLADHRNELFLEGLSDRDAIRQLRTRIDGKVACGLALDDPGFDFTVLTYWRTRLRQSERPQRIFDAVRAVVEATGVLKTKHRRALDSSILDDAVATQDTVTQLIAAMRRVRRSVPQAARVPLTTASDEGAKPVIEWSDQSARNALLTGLVNDAFAVLAAAESTRIGQEANDDVGLLALIAGQDVEPGAKEGTWRIANKVAKDRVISTVDVEARHGHKSTAVRTDGFKAHLATEPDTGIVTAAKLTPANHADGPVGVALMQTSPTVSRSWPIRPMAQVPCAALLGRGTTALSSSRFPHVPTSPAGSPATTSRWNALPAVSPARRACRPALCKWHRQLRPALCDLCGAVSLHQGQGAQHHRF